MKFCSRVFSLFLFLTASQAFSQYTDIINTNRPGQSHGAYSVGRGVYQLEMGLGYGKEKHDIWNTKSTDFYTDYAIRIGLFFEELEISLTGGFKQQDITYSDYPGSKEKIRDFTSNTLGAKFLVYDPYIKRVKEGPNLYSWRKNNTFQWRDLIPAVSVYAGMNMDSKNNPYMYEQEFTISPKFMVATQNNWLDGWVFVTNFIVDKISTEYPSYEYLLTLTKSMRSGTSIFVENHGIFGDYYSDQLLNFGVAQLINSNLQVDLSGQVNFKDTPSKAFAKIGFSYRLDRHRDNDYVEEKGSLFGNKKRKLRKQKENEERLENILENME